MSARRKTDPAVTAWDKIQAANEACIRTTDEQEDAEARALAAGFKVQHPMVTVGQYCCMGMQEARYRARELAKADAAKALDAMRTALATWRQQRRKGGLVRYDAAYRRADREWHDAMQAMADTRSTTSAGVILKLQLLELELRDGNSGYGEAIAASAIADLKRIARSAK